MDWSLERYVRLYTRDTGTWVALSWQARCVFPLLMRKVDRDGRLSIPGQAKPEAIVAKLLDGPVRFVKTGLEDLAAVGVIELTTSGIVIPNFAEAQETRSRGSDGAKSDAERAKAYRERKKGQPRDAVTERHDANVTSRDASRPSPPSGAEPCLAVLSGAVPTQTRAGEDAWVEVEQVAGRLAWIGPEGLPKLMAPRDRIHKLVVEGATAEEICRVLDGFSAAIAAGKEPRKLWDAQYVFSGYFGRLRIEYGSGAAPEAETPQETLRRLKGAS